MHSGGYVHKVPPPWPGHVQNPASPQQRQQNMYGQQQQYAGRPPGGAPQAGMGASGGGIQPGTATGVPSYSSKFLRLRGGWQLGGSGPPGLCGKIRILTKLQAGTVHSRTSTSSISSIPRSNHISNSNPHISNPLRLHHPPHRLYTSISSSSGTSSLSSNGSLTLKPRLRRPRDPRALFTTP